MSYEVVDLLPCCCEDIKPLRVVISNESLNFDVVVRFFLNGKITCHYFLNYSLSAPNGRAPLVRQNYYLWSNSPILN